MAKAIANRFRGVIDKCIDSAQSTILPGRLISDNIPDNILLAYELLHTLKQRRMGKNGYIVVKLDTSKAYDRVEWRFIKEVILRIGFEQNCVASIMNCMSTVSYQVVVNGGIGRIFRPTRGLRQVDSLSPFLFLICAEGLYSLMRLNAREGLLKRVKASRTGPQVTHLLFADDCILFGEATRKGTLALKEILREYKRCSG